ncbi:golgin subfamily A member 6-like protein 2 [Watersipora subatra]|uniref:golgin subfamily A member 6-like protein 2 n=1 Tax=Watersipora subatra TaxID=2589382 RepID=UPI00355C1E6E
MESGFPKLVFGEHGDGSWERFIEEMNLCIESAVERRGYEGEGENRRPIMRGRARDRREVGYDGRGSSRRSGGSRDNSYERYGSRDSSGERYRGRGSPREIRDKFGRYRDNSMDRFEGEKYKERYQDSSKGRSVETSHRKPVEPASYWGERGKDGRDGHEVEESLLTQPKDSGLVRVGGSSVGSDSGHGGGDSGHGGGDGGHGGGDGGHGGGDGGHGGGEGGGGDQESSAAEYDSSPGLLESDGTQEVSMEEDLG